MPWNDLSMAEKASIMALGVQSGVTNLDDIRKGYNSFARGGHLYSGEEEPTQQMSRYGGAEVRNRSGRLLGYFNTKEEAEQYIKDNNREQIFREPELGEIVVTPKRSLLEQGASNFEETFGMTPRDAAGFIPVVGDALDIRDIANNLQNKEYTEAGIGALMFLLPNIIEKPAKRLFKYIKGIKNGTIRRFKDIPIEQNKYYRQVSSSAIDDANISGVIRANPGSYQHGKKMNYAGASFRRGGLYNPSDHSEAIIVGEPNIEWVPKIQGGHIEVDDFDLPLSRSHVLEPNNLDDMTPIFVDQVNIAPTDRFYYWKRGKGLIGKHFYTKEQFNPYPFDSPEDLEYLKALDSGEIELAQRLRDQHFLKSAPLLSTSLVDSGGSPLKLYHNSPNEGIVTFDLSKTGTTDYGTLGHGIYTTPYEDYASLYGPYQYSLYGNISNPRDLRGTDSLEIGLTRQLLGEQAFTGFGIDGIIANPLIGTPSKLPFEVVGFKPSQFKFSDAVTRDDRGLIIPLSKRDNFTINDMRYSLGGILE